jgi:hypothetical protein
MVQEITAFPDQTSVLGHEQAMARSIKLDNLETRVAEALSLIELISSRSHTVEEFLKDKTIREILSTAYRDSMFCAKLFYGEDFYKPMSSLHEKIFEIYDAYKAGTLGYNKVLMLGPRGFGKSTICEFLVKDQISWEEKHFIGYMSHSLEGGSELRTEAIKADLLTNSLLRLMFKPIETIDVEDSLINDKSMQFSKKSYVAGGRTLVLPRGAGQQVRGLKWTRFRPDMWVIDDLLNRDNLRSESYRKKIAEWFDSDFVNTISRYDDNYFMMYIDTKKHAKDIPFELENDPDWLTIKLKLAAPDPEGSTYKTLMPDYMSQAELDKEIKKYRKKGRMTIFYQEFMSTSIAPEDNAFVNNLHFYDEADEGFKEARKRILNLLIVDPSRTSNPKNNPYGFSLVGLDLDGGDNEMPMCYFRKAYAKHLTPLDFYNEVFALNDLFPLMAIAIETTGLEQHITYPLKSEMIKRGTYIEVIELKSRGGKGAEFKGEEGGKIGRAMSFLANCQRDVVRLNRNATADLEDQCMSFPNCAEWDVLDTAAYLDQALDKLELFLAPNEGAEDYEERAADIEAEYDDLYDEGPLDQAKFRSI